MSRRFGRKHTEDLVDEYLCEILGPMFQRKDKGAR